MNFNVAIKILLLIISGLSGIVIGERMILPPDHQYIINPDGTSLLLGYKNWRIQSASKWQCDVLITKVDHFDTLDWFSRGWVKLYGMPDLAALSYHWKPRTPKSPQPEPVKDPNLPMIEGLYFTLGDTFAVHTYLDCQHLIGKEDRIALIFDPHDVAERNICLTCVARRTREDE